jgi:hypothetical protein
MTSLSNSERLSWLWLMIAESTECSVPSIFSPVVGLHLLLIAEKLASISENSDEHTFLPQVLLCY